MEKESTENKLARLLNQIAEMKTDAELAAAIILKDEFDARMRELYKLEFLKRQSKLS